MSPKTWCNSRCPCQEPKSVFRLFLFSLSYQQDIHHYQYLENFQVSEHRFHLYHLNACRFSRSQCPFLDLWRFVTKDEWSSEPQLTTSCVHDHTITFLRYLRRCYCQHSDADETFLSIWKEHRIFKKLGQTLTKNPALMTQNTWKLKQNVSDFNKTKQNHTHLYWSYFFLISLGVQNDNPSPCS